MKPKPLYLLIGAFFILILMGFLLWPDPDAGVRKPDKATSGKTYNPQNLQTSKKVSYQDSTRKLVISDKSTVTKKPGGGKVLMKIDPKTPWSKSQNALLIVGSIKIKSQDYYEVLLPIKPNGTTGWVKADPVKNSLMRQQKLIRVNLAARNLTYLENGKVIKTFPVVIGAPKSPTPRGLFAVRDRFATDPKLFTGSHMIVLTGYSETLESFDGGEARIAIHGRGPSSLKDPLGSAKSNGCLRMENKHVKALAELVEPGVGVVIT